MTAYPEKIFLIGLMGVGKSYWCRRLEDYFAIPAFDLDALIEKEAGMTVSEIFEKKGEDVFREMEASMLKSSALPNAFVLACGGGTPCFHNNLDYMLQQGLVIWLDASLPNITRRVLAEQGKRPLLDAAENTDQLQERLDRLLSARIQYYSRAHLHIDADTITLDEFIEQIETFYHSNEHP